LTTFDVRPYDQARDAEPLRALIIEHQDFHRGLEPSWPEGKTIIDAYVTFLTAQCAAHDGRIMVAERSGVIVGFICVVSSARNDSPDDPATFAWVHDVFVRLEHRRQGIGAALLADAEAFGRSRGARELRLGVLERNETARALYQAKGFRDYARVLTKPLT
jgi:GNAT superfamily N-acetyltransferase